MIFMAGQFQCPAAMQGIFLIDDYCDDDMLQRDTEGEDIGKEIPGSMHFYAALFVIACN